MDDRELLEAAAKAAGMSGTTVDYDDRLVFLEDGKPASIEWNPLTDDGDALRLAIKLRLHINIEPYGTAARRQGMDWHGCESHLHGGLEAATRRAIVKAAAAMSGERG